MNKVNINLFLHLVAQILAQSAVIAIVPFGSEKYVAAAVAILGVIIAFSDQSLSKS